MRKDVGVISVVYPMPVLMVAAYDEKGVVNALIFYQFQSGYYVTGEKVVYENDKKFHINS